MCSSDRQWVYQMSDSIQYRSNHAPCWPANPRLTSAWPLSLAGLLSIHYVTLVIRVQVILTRNIERCWGHALHHYSWISREAGVGSLSHSIRHFLGFPACLWWLCNAGTPTSPSKLLISLRPSSTCPMFVHDKFISVHAIAIHHMISVRFSVGRRDNYQQAGLFQVDIPTKVCNCWNRRCILSGYLSNLLW